MEYFPSFKKSFFHWLLLGQILASSPGWAGDAHYWTNQFGTKSDLLSGAVIGAVVDASQAYYNPGALGRQKDRSLVLSGSAFEYATIQVGQGEREKLSTTNAGLLPNFLAGTLPLRSAAGGTLSYSVLTRQTFDANFVRRRETTAEVFAASPGLEDFAGKNSFEQKVSESWFGISWARPIGEHVGIGLTQYFAYRSQKSRFETFASAFNESTGQVGTFSSFREGDYNHLRTLWKPGILLDYKPVKFGLTVTTPGIGLFGSGNAYTYQSRAGIDVDGDGTADPLYSESFQEDLKTHYHSPWAVGFGASLGTRNTTYYASAEWYDAVKVFDVFDTHPYLSQSAGTMVTPHIQQALHSVLNYAVGFEQRLYEKIAFYGSFSTDKSALDRQSDVSFAPWDAWQFLVGTAFRFKHMAVTFGTGYGAGHGDSRPNADFENPSQANQLLGNSTPADISYRRFKFIFGFTIDLPASEGKKKKEDAVTAEQTSPPSAPSD
jgi:hypothetical protein